MPVALPPQRQPMVMVNVPQLPITQLPVNTDPRLVLQRLNLFSRIHRGLTPPLTHDQIGITPVVDPAVLKCAEECAEQGQAAKARGQPDEALQHFYCGMRHNPHDFTCLCNAAATLLCVDQVPAALELYLQAFELAFCTPLINSHTLLTSIGICQLSVGHFPLSLLFLGVSLQLAPAMRETLASFVYAMHSVCLWTERDQLLAILQKSVQRSLETDALPAPAPMHCFVYPFDDELVRDMCTRNAELVRKSVPPERVYSQIGRQFEADVIRIGYVSSDFGDHPLGHLMGSVFGMHSRPKFRVYLYALGKDDGSAVRRQVMRGSDVFRDCSSLSASKSAQLIYEDGIQVLLNLNGYTKGCRTEVFAHQPSPVQAQYMGFAGTLGADFIPYIITDPVASPEEHAHIYTEKMLYMPHSYFVNDCAQSYPQCLECGEDTVRYYRARYLPQISEGTIVFANFNKLVKVDPPMFDLWCNILKRVPASVLWLLRFPGAAEANLRHEAAKRGVPQHQLHFTDCAAKQEHLLRGCAVDMFLDTFGYNAHTTACDILWGGTPILTAPGIKMASRVAASVVCAAGNSLWKDLICSSFQEMENRAVAIAHDPVRLAELKARVRLARVNSPCFDTTRWVAALESGLEQMWQRHACGLEPANIHAVDPGPQGKFRNAPGPPQDDEQCGKGRWSIAVPNPPLPEPSQDDLLPLDLEEMVMRHGASPSSSGMSVVPVQHAPAMVAAVVFQPVQVLPALMPVAHPMPQLAGQMVMPQPVALSLQNNPQQATLAAPAVVQQIVPPVVQPVVAQIAPCSPVLPQAVPVPVTRHVSSAAVLASPPQQHPSRCRDMRALTQAAVPAACIRAVH
eukprot:TRINITY_DN6214_c1_g1_i1.p1 TRINITY_DN6214_c1_g1~~TRINITY_DN6214_c1_g1_i1.p1  ORF type:complete len:924 (+),score=170.80 TRINITY_DN6214_c1_g1_i1:220-2772(+)